jgi:hypothetical protein
MSLPNGSIANLLVTRKSLITRNLECPSPVPFPQDWSDERANKKSRRWKGAGVGRNKKPALNARRHASNEKPALEGRRLSSRDFSRRAWRREDRSMITSGCSRRPL